MTETNIGLLPEYLYCANRLLRFCRPEAVDHPSDLRTVYLYLEVIILLHPSLSLPVEFLFLRGIGGEVKLLRCAACTKDEISYAVNQIVLGRMGMTVENNDIEIPGKWFEVFMRISLLRQRIMANLYKGGFVINYEDMIGP